jgi:hypothetical protein
LNWTHVLRDRDVGDSDTKSDDLEVLSVDLPGEGGLGEEERGELGQVVEVGDLEGGLDAEVGSDVGDKLGLGHGDLSERGSVPGDGESLREEDGGVERTSVSDGSNETGVERGVAGVRDHDRVDVEDRGVDNLLDDGSSEDGEKELENESTSVKILDRKGVRTYRKTRIGVRGDSALRVGEIGRELSDVEDRDEVDGDSEGLEGVDDVRREVEVGVVERTLGEGTLDEGLDDRGGRVVVESGVHRVKARVLLGVVHGNLVLGRVHVVEAVLSGDDVGLGGGDELVGVELLLLVVTLRHSSGEGRGRVGDTSERDDSIESGGVLARLYDERTYEGEDVRREEVEVTGGTRRVSTAIHSRRVNRRRTS